MSLIKPLCSLGNFWNTIFYIFNFTRKTSSPSNVLPHHPGSKFLSGIKSIAATSSLLTLLFSNFDCSNQFSSFDIFQISKALYWLLISSLFNTLLSLSLFWTELLKILIYDYVILFLSISFFLDLFHSSTCYYMYFLHSQNSLSLKNHIYCVLHDELKISYQCVVSFTITKLK